jgi:hypothetical protein
MCWKVKIQWQCYPRASERACVTLSPLFGQGKITFLDCRCNSASAHFQVSWLSDFIFYPKPLYKSLHQSFFYSFITILPSESGVTLDYSTGKSAVFLMESALTSHGSSKSYKKPPEESRTRLEHDERFILLSIHTF